MFVIIRRYTTGNFCIMFHRNVARLTLFEGSFIRRIIKSQFYMVRVHRINDHAKSFSHADPV